jgi:lysophospholipase L1-like esterase
MRDRTRHVLSLALAGLLGALTSCAAPGAAEPLDVAGLTILFQGDSITDAGRSRNEKHAGVANSAQGLGRGYASITADSLMVAAAPEAVQVFNRGVSGNKVFQLAARWEEDCLALEPDVLSILIGVNDIWHTRNGKYDGTPEVYERDYDALLARTRAALPDVSLVVCEPFVLPCGSVDETWFPEFDEYRAASRRVADKHGARFVPFHTMFEAALEHHPAEHWARDGVHPSRAGAALMAKEWLRVLRAPR